MFGLTDMKFSIKKVNGEAEEIEIKVGEKLLIIGPNGSGKTHLGIHLDKEIKTASVTGGNNSEREIASIIKKNSLKRKVASSIEKNKHYEEYLNYFSKDQFDDNLRTYQDSNQTIHYGMLTPYEYIVMAIKDDAKNSPYIEWQNTETLKFERVHDLEALEKIRHGKLFVRIPITVYNKGIPGIDDEYFYCAEFIAILNHRQNLEEARKKYYIFYEAKLEESSKMYKKDLEEYERRKIKFTRRIAANRSLTAELNKSISSREDAEEELLGKPDDQDKYKEDRFKGKDATEILNDFNTLLHFLHSDHNSITVENNEGNSGEKGPAKSFFNQIAQIWKQIFKSKEIFMDKFSLYIRPINELYPASTVEKNYPFTELSDGERSMFYVLAQCVVAWEGTILIIDEPELHLHKALLYPFWSKITEELKDSRAFVFITHEPSFWSLTSPDKRYSIRNYKYPNNWDIKKFDSESLDIPENLLNELLGARKPILLVEGKKESLDILIYKEIYSDYRIIAAGSSNDVIQSVKKLATHDTHHWLDFYGIIDRDDKSDAKIKGLRKNNRLRVLEYNELENYFLDKEVAKLVFEENFKEEKFKEKRFSAQVLKGLIIDYVKEDKNRFIKKYTLRRIKTLLEKKWQDLENIENPYIKKGECLGSIIEGINVCQISKDIESKLNRFIREEGIDEILKHYRNKKMYTSVFIDLLELKGIKVNDRIKQILGSSKKLRELLKFKLPKLPTVKKKPA